MKKVILFVLAVMLMLPAPSQANVLNDAGNVDINQKHVKSTDWNTGKGRHDAIVRWAAKDNYFAKGAGMFGRGFSNLAFGWVEVFKQPINWSKNSILGVGQVQGLVMGVTMGTLRTASGALDIATFWVPYWYGVPMGKPALGLKDVHEFEVIEDAEAYDLSTKRYLFD